MLNVSRQNFDCTSGLVLRLYVTVLLTVGNKVEKLQTDYRALAIKEQELLIMQEGATLRREINCATKRAQQIRIDKGHEATVVMAQVDYDRHFIHDPDETINALIVIRFANRREVTVLR